MSVTGIVVSCNTPDLIRDAVESLKSFHSKMNIIIVDGSDKGNSCQYVVKNLCNKHKGVKAFLFGSNIGHGIGLDFGIKQATSKNVLIFDSDIEVKKPVIQDMLIHGRFYGIGQVVYVDNTGRNAATGIKYLHPHFAIISRREYFAHPGFRNAGAPLLVTMRSVNSNKIIDFNVSEYVLHKERGTRIILKPEERSRAQNIQRKQITQHLASAVQFGDF